MAEFNIRSDNVDVEQIMRQIRARIREKRGVDYSEEEIRQLASVRLEKFLDPRNVRSELTRHYKAHRPAIPPPLDVPAPDNYPFEADTIYVSSRGFSGSIIAFMRKLLNPILKLMFNPNPLIHVLHKQSEINQHNAQLFGRVSKYLEEQFAPVFEQHFKLHDELDVLNYELLNNLVLEMTKLGIENKNLKMRVESLASRLDFAERRARALEAIVQYRPDTDPTAQAPTSPPSGARQQPAASGDGADTLSAAARRRRRRRRGRRHGSGASPAGAVEQDALSTADSEEAPDESDAGNTVEADADPQPPAPSPDEPSGSDEQ
jgi:hypothetical protein